MYPGSKTCPTDKIRARLKTFTVEELKLGIDHFAADWWCMKTNGKRPAVWFFHDDARSETYLNMTPRPSPSGEQRGGAHHAPGTRPNGTAQPAPSRTNVRTY